MPAIRLPEYVKLYKPFYPNFSDEILQGCLADFELPADVRLGELSMGQRKKAYIAFAMATNTKYLLNSVEIAVPQGDCPAHDRGTYGNDFYPSGTRRGADVGSYSDS